MFNHKRTVITEDYPDNDHNGVPDAFENRPPLAEVLGFSDNESKPIPSPLLTVQRLDLIAVNSSPKPKPKSSYLPLRSAQQDRRCGHGRLSYCTECEKYLSELLRSENDF